MGAEILGWILNAIPGGSGIILALSLVGSFRIVFKLVNTFIYDISRATAFTTYDDTLVDTWQKSKVYATIAYLLDLLASIKLPAKK